jgi:hypothetical protein
MLGRGDRRGIVFRDPVAGFGWGCFGDGRGDRALPPPGESTSYAGGCWLEVLATVDDFTCIFRDLGLTVLVAAEHLSEAAASAGRLRLLLELVVLGFALGAGPALID